MEEITDQALRAQFAVDTREIWTTAANAANEKILWPILFRMFWLDIVVIASQCNESIYRY